MPRVSEAFDYEVGTALADLDRFDAAAAGVAATDTTVSGGPVIASDALGTYAGPGTAVLAAGALVLQSPVAQVTAIVELANVGSLLRIVAPYNELVGTVDDVATIGPPVGRQYLEIEVQMVAGALAQLAIYLTDPASLGGADHTLIAARTLTSGADAGRLLVRWGPRCVRVWWDQDDGARFSRELLTREFRVRRAPDLAAYIPEIDHASWGFLLQDGKLRFLRTDADPTAADADTLAAAVAVNASTPDDGVPPLGDTSHIAQVHYAVTPQAKARRAQVVLGLAGTDSTGRLSDHWFTRVDPAQTLLLCPSAEVHTLWAATLAGGRSGPSCEPQTIAVDGDTAGILDGGIGSGRRNLSFGGELCLNLPVSLQGSGLGDSLHDWATALGGQEVYQQIASTAQRTWPLEVRCLPEIARHAELVAGASGGARPVWSLPPLEPGPVACFMSAVSHDTSVKRRIPLRCTVTEVG